MKSKASFELRILNYLYCSDEFQVQFLEQQNKVLETKWSLLKGQKVVQNNLELMFELYISSMRWQLEALGGERLQLSSELEAVQDFREHPQKDLPCFPSLCSSLHQ